MTLSEQVTKLEQDHARLRAALEMLTTMYIANPGTKNEFISCITPPGAYEMTPEQRRLSKTWRAWDNAVRVLAETA